MIAKKKAASPQMRIVRPTTKPVPMPTRKPNRAPGQATPVPMPTRDSNYGRNSGIKQRPMPRGPKKSGTSGPAMPSRTKRSPARRKMI
jgi:hypothetical protein